MSWTTPLLRDHRFAAQSRVGCVMAVGDDFVLCCDEMLHCRIVKIWKHVRKGLGDKKGELSLVEDVIWTSSKRWTGQPMESSRGLGNLQRFRLLFEDFLNLLNSPLVDRSNVSTRSKLHLQPMTTRLSYLLNPFLLATALTIRSLLFCI